MPYPFQLTIPQLCQAVWADMDQRQNGRHCTQCCKTVVDFTGMSDQDLRKAMDAAPAGL